MLKTWQEALDADHAAQKPVTSATVAAVKRQGRWLRGSVRLTVGRIVTDAEYRRRRDQALRNRL